MNTLQSKDLNVIVNIQYGIGFQLIEGQIEMEITFLNITRRSRIVPAASRNRINFYEEFLWTIDKNTLKYCRTTNEMLKFECFKTPHIYYENSNRRLRIGYTMIKLKEFPITAYEWDQSVSPKYYKLYGSGGNYEFRIILKLQDGLGLDNYGKTKKRLEFNNKEHHFTSTKQLLNLHKQDSMENNNTTLNSTKRGKLNNYQQKNVKTDEENQKIEKYRNKKELQFQKALNECNAILKDINMDEKQHKKSRKKEMINEIKVANKKFEHLINECKECLKTNEFNEYEPRKLVETCLERTEEGFNIMRKIKNDLETKKF